MRDQKRPDLPAGMPSRERDFFAELRRLVDTAGLTVRGLEESTSLAKSPAAESFSYSKSQWSRWLNGHSRPPRRAVRRLTEKLADMDRAEVYEECANLLFRKWDARRGIHASLRVGYLVEPAIRHLAWWLLTRDSLEPAVTRGELLSELTEFLARRGIEPREPV